MVDMNVNEIIFDVQRYESFEAMMADVSKVMEVLVRNTNIMVFEYSDAGIYVLRYAHDEKYGGYGVVNPKWISENEWHNVCIMREEEEW